MITRARCAHRWRQELAAGVAVGWDTVCRRCGVRILFRAGAGQLGGQVQMRARVQVPAGVPFDLALVAYAQQELDRWVADVAALVAGDDGRPGARPQRRAARAAGR